MGEDKAEKALGSADKYFDKLSSWLSERIAAFVSFLFLLFGAGAIYGTYVIPRFPGYEFYLLAAPIGIALVAYYNRSLATILFAGLVLFFVL